MYYNDENSSNLYTIPATHTQGVENHMNVHFFSHFRKQGVGYILNRIFLVLFTLLSLALLFVAISSKMLTPLLTGILVGVVAILLLLVWLLSLRHPTKARRTTATILALILSVVFAAAVTLQKFQTK